MSTEGELLEWEVDIWSLRHFSQNSSGQLLIDGVVYTPGSGSPTASEIKTLYESNADTNAFDDSEQTKLAGIESGATADQSDSEIETAYNNQVAVVSQAAAEAGSSSTTSRWTPERVKQAIQALVPAQAAIQIPGTCFEPPASGGSDGYTSEEVGSNVILFNQYPDAADTYSMASNVLMPLNYDSGSAVDVQVEWSVNSTSINDVRFTVQTAGQGEGDALNASLNTATAITDTNSSTVNQRHVTAWTSLDVTGITAGDSFLLRLDRTATHVSDTLAANIRVHAVRVRYTTKIN